MPHPYFVRVPIGTAGRLLKKHHATVWRMCRHGHLPTERHEGSAEMIPIAALELRFGEFSAEEIEAALYPQRHRKIRGIT